MGLLDNIGKFRVGGSINTQFETSIGIERILIGLGQKAGGLTSFLTTLEMIGYVLLIFWGVFFIALIVIIHILLFIISVFRYFWSPKAEKVDTLPDMTDEEIATSLARFEVTEEEEEEVRNFN